MSTCRNVEVVGVRYVRGGIGRLGENCVKDNMEVLGLRPEWAVFRDVWRDFIRANV